MQLNLTYTFPSKLKTTSFVLMGLGLLLTILAFVFDHGPEGAAHGEYNHTHFWANILICAFFFMGIGLGATFFMALKYASEAHYTAAFKRVYEAVSDWLWIAGPILVLVILLGQFHVHHLYHWMDPSVYDTASPHFDNKIAAKEGYFTPWFFWLRTAGFMFVWMWCQRTLRNRSLLEDQAGGTLNHFKNVKTSAIFLVFFGFTSSVAAWDWLMSLDVHWFSTMFGWYVFSGIWISAMIATLVIVLYLKDNGYLEHVNESHIHDLGKWMFAISFLWSYLFFCQFMLIWYANIPEEVTYFQNRLETNGYKFMFWLVFFVNFALPMLFLMSRDAKRNRRFLITVGFIIFIFHWLDIYMIVMPSTVGRNPGIGIFEIGPFLLFLGGFIYFVMGKLTKAPLLPVNHPYIEESKHHSI
jgi:hypothetical protein